jgi:hypothetical protein
MKSISAYYKRKTLREVISFPWIGRCTTQFYSLRKLFWHHYYRNNKQSPAVSAANRSALLKAILDVMKNNKRNKNSTESSNPRKRKELPPLDTNSFDYQMMMNGWNSNSNHLLVHAPGHAVV